MTVDLGRQLQIPPHIIILVSEATRQLIPGKRMEEAHKRKREKYQELVEDCQSNGWMTRCMPVEVGSRGFASHSLSKAYSTLGIIGANQRIAIKNTAEAAEKASRRLWLKSEFQLWYAESPVLHVFRCVGAENHLKHVGRLRKLD